MKIVYCINSIRGIGGIQKVTIYKANALAEIETNEVYIVVTDDWKIHPETATLSNKVHFIKLNVNYYKNDYKSKCHLYFSYLKFFKHWFLLQKFINTINPDVIISVGQSEKYILPLLNTKAKRIREIHFASNYRFHTYKSHQIALFLNFLDYRIASKGYDRVVLLTKEDKETFFLHDKKFIYIPNLLTSNKILNNHLLRQKKVVSVGRLDVPKDFISLIRVWKLVCAKVDDWNLEIIGEGPERKLIEDEIRKCHLSNRITLPGYSVYVDSLLNSASIFALTSLYEGFPLVILEAMNAGLPVVSYTCQFGPRDIISDGKDGFLIENRNEYQMAKKILELIANRQEREKMSQAARLKVEQYSTSVIIQKWMNLFRSELK